MFLDDLFSSKFMKGSKLSTQSSESELKPTFSGFEKSKSSNMMFGEFGSSLQVKSLDTIAKEYQTNKFFKIKIDLLLKQLDKEYKERPLSLEKKHSNFETLKSQLDKENKAYRLRLKQIKKRINEIKVTKV